MGGRATRDGAGRAGSTWTHPTPAARSHLRRLLVAVRGAIPAARRCAAPSEGSIHHRSNFYNFCFAGRGGALTIEIFSTAPSTGRRAHPGNDDTAGGARARLQGPRRGRRRVVPPPLPRPPRRPRKSLEAPGWRVVLLLQPRTRRARADVVRPRPRRVPRVRRRDAGGRLVAPAARRRIARRKAAGGATRAMGRQPMGRARDGGCGSDAIDDDDDDALGSSAGTLRVGRVRAAPARPGRARPDDPVRAEDERPRRYERRERFASDVPVRRHSRRVRAMGRGGGVAMGAGRTRGRGTPASARRARGGARLVATYLMGAVLSFFAQVCSLAPTRSFQAIFR